jgi:hypothetical protein
MPVCTVHRFFCVERHQRIISNSDTIPSERWYRSENTAPNTKT